MRRADECRSEALACLDQIVRHAAIGFPVNPDVVRYCLILSEMSARYSAACGTAFGHIGTTEPPNSYDCATGYSATSAPSLTE
jgi:hypothetical protein